MKQEQKRKKLLDFLDRKAFDPVLYSSENRYESEDKKKKLRELKEKTEKEKQRFHKNYGSPTEIKDNFLSDLNSLAAKKVHSELKYLDLPRLPDLKKEFLDLYEELEEK